MKTLRKRLSTLRIISTPAEALLFARVTAFAAVVPLLMMLPLPRLAWILRLPRLSRCDDPAKVARFVDASIRVAAPLVRPGCLTRAITLWQFLRVGRPGLSLKFGMGEVDGSWEGHCWLEQEGSPLLERVDPRPVFAVTYSVDQRQAA